MAQGVLPFNYEAEKNRSGMTALAGLPTFLDLGVGLRAAGVDRSTRGRAAGHAGLERSAGGHVADPAQSRWRRLCGRPLDVARRSRLCRVDVSGGNARYGASRAPRTLTALSQRTHDGNAFAVIGLSVSFGVS